MLTLSASFEAATSEGERAPKGEAPSASAGFAGQLPMEIWTFGPVAAHVGIELRKFEEVNLPERCSRTKNSLSYGKRASSHIKPPPGPRHSGSRAPRTSPRDHTARARTPTARADLTKGYSSTAPSPGASSSSSPHRLKLYSSSTQATQASPSQEKKIEGAGEGAAAIYLLPSRSALTSQSMPS